MDLFCSDGHEECLKLLLAQHGVPGLAISLVQDQRIKSRGFGLASLEASLPFRPSTLISVGSLSKSFTAAAVALLANDNDHANIRLDTSMASLLPEDFVLQGTDQADVTVEDILSHRTGMPPHELSMFGPNAPYPDDMRSITRNLRNLSRAAPNRNGFIYCNMMYSVAAYLVESKSGYKFAEYLRRHIFAPLSMKSTYSLSNARAEWQQTSLAVGYLRDKESGTYRIASQSKAQPELQGAGQIVSSAGDCAKFLKALINREEPITERIFQDLTTPRVSQNSPSDGLPDEQTISYALGWEVRQYRDATIITHNGGDIGYQCCHFFIPQRRFGGVFFSNSDEAAPLISHLTFQYIDAVIGTSHIPFSLDGSLGPATEPNTETSDEEYYRLLEEDLRTELGGGSDVARAQIVALSAYTGRFWNHGYRSIDIEVRGEHLFVNARDRSLAFTLTFKHVCEQTKYIALIDHGQDDPKVMVKAEFRFVGDMVAAVGIELEERLEQYIWFMKDNSKGRTNSANKDLPAGWM